jgi:hypothetical protein
MVNVAARYDLRVPADALDARGALKIELAVKLRAVVRAEWPASYRALT